MDARLAFREDPNEFFESIKGRLGGTWNAVAESAKVSVRTITSWRSRDTAMPSEVAQLWSTRFALPLPSHTVVDIDEKRRLAGSMGGKARTLIYGNPGTLEGRIRGGKKAVATHKKNPNSPFTARAVANPRHSTSLAELVGAILGDGTITSYQLVLYSNLKDESEYAAYLASLIKQIFLIAPSLVRDPVHGVHRIICSRRQLVTHLASVGLDRGNKTKRQAGVPAWIEKNRQFSRACLRGLIDTDGCVYLDKHRVKGKSYASTCIAFTNASTPLLDFVERTLVQEGYTPTRWGRNIRVRRRDEVLRYAREIGFSNPKHSRKIAI